MECAKFIFYNKSIGGGNKNGLFTYGQSLTTKSIVALGYKFTQYLFIGGEF